MSLHKYPTQRVVWREGTLLRPQHFQQQQRQLETEAKLRVGWTRPFAWGINRLDLDRARLDRGELAITRIEAIMPSGSILSLQEDACADAVCNLDEHFDPDTQTLTAYLCVRYHAQGDPRTDECTQMVSLPDQSNIGQSAEIEVAWPRVQLRLGDPGEGECLPIARILRQEGRYQLDATFIAPHLKAGHCQGLAKGMRTMLAALHERHNTLWKARRQSTHQQLHIEGADLELYLWLSALGGAIATLETIQHSTETTPYQVYLELCRLVGNLWGLCPQATTPRWEGYSHEHAHRCFDAIFAQLSACVQQAGARRHRCIDLSRRSDGMWLTKLQDPLFAQSSVYVLAVHGPHGPQDAQQRLPALAKVACFQDISTVIDSAVSGARLEPLTSPPLEVPVRPGWAYFRIDAQSSYWKQVRLDKTLAFYAGPPFDGEDTKISLYYVPEIVEATLPLTDVAG